MKLPRNNSNNNSSIYIALPRRVFISRQKRSKAQSRNKVSSLVYLNAVRLHSSFPSKSSLDFLLVQATKQNLVSQAVRY